MGKSPGKWIKTVLFRKKSSKSFPQNVRTEKGRVVAKTPETDSFVAPDFFENDVVTKEKLERDTGVAADLPSERGLSPPHFADSFAQETSERGLSPPHFADSVAQETSERGLSPPHFVDLVAQETSELDVLGHAETMRRKQAATKVQAALRGYLARREFQALKGIIRVQAFVRGHLVRRQAVSTLYGMMGIVKLQAVARGRKVRCSNTDLQVKKGFIAANHLESDRVDPIGVITLVKKSKLSSNNFVCKLLVSSPKAMPLLLQYKSSEPNSVATWFGRWSVALSKPFLPTVSQPNESEISKGKLGNRTNLLSNTLTQSTNEIEKPRRNFRKILSRSVDTLQDHPQNELEKVKRSLRKVHNPNTEVSIQSNLEIEKPKSDQVEVSNSPSKRTEKKTIASSKMINQETYVSLQSKLEIEKPYLQDQDKVLSTSSQIIEMETKKTKDSSEEMKQESDVTISNLPKLEAHQELVNEATAALQDDQPTVESQPFDDSGEGDSVPVSNPEISTMQDHAASENRKSAKKVSSSPKNEHAENGIRSRSTVPSYMAATKSAKAKLRAQGSPQFAEDVNEKQNLTRRHSLPALTNSKTSSPSPRAVRAVQSSGRCVSRSDKSLLSSRDGNPRAVQVEWRR